MKKMKEFEEFTRQEKQRIHNHLESTYGEGAYMIESWRSRKDSLDYILCDVDVRRESDDKLIVVYVNVDMTDRRKSFIHRSELM